MKTVIICGLGREGEAALDYLQANHPETDIIASEDREEVRRRVAQAWAGKPHRIVWTARERLLGEFLPAAAPEATLLLRSPGIPPENPVIAAARERNIRTTTFTGFWAEEHASRVPATVTGTKGKSTTTTLAAAILSGAGTDTAASGNIGLIPSEIGDVGTHVLLELSSYQLVDFPAAAPVHAITNLYRDHLDWHGGFEAYAKAKAAPAIADPGIATLLRRADREHLSKWIERPLFVEDIVHLDGANIRIRHAERSVTFEAPEWLRVKLEQSAIVRENARMALAIATLVHGAPDEALGQSFVAALSQDMQLPSRCEPAGDFAGRTWIDDALATIPEATLAALRSVPAPEVRLIAGGKDRGQNFRELSDYLNRHAVRITVHAYGPTAERLAATVRNIRLADSLEDALRQALKESAPGAVLLFSPAAASFEPDTTYVERSRRFREFARNAGD